VTIDQARNHYGPGDIEAELIAAEEVFIAPVLANFVGYGIERIVAEIFEEAAMPVEERTVTALGGAVRAQSQVAGLDLELLNGAVHLRSWG